VVLTGTWIDCCPLFLIYKEIFNFKLPKLKMLAIEFFDLHSQVVGHSLTQYLAQYLSISNLRILLYLGFLLDHTSTLNLPEERDKYLVKKVNDTSST
jgi:hypothetical protein